MAAAGIAAILLTAAPLAGSAQEEAKYGVVDISRVITQSDEGQAEAAELEAFGAGKERELTARRREIEELIRQYDESADSGEPDAALRDRIERMKRQLERDVRQAQSDVDASRQERIQAIGNKVVNLVRKFGQENGYIAIFRTDGGQVIHARPDSDITDQVIDAYNEAYPVD